MVMRVYAKAPKSAQESEFKELQTACKQTQQLLKLSCMLARG